MQKESFCDEGLLSVFSFFALCIDCQNLGYVIIAGRSPYSPQ